MKPKNTIRKSDLIQLLAEDVQLSKADAARFLESLLARIEQQVREGGEVNITRFGKFKAVTYAERESNVPSKEGKTIVSGHTALRFKASRTQRW